MGYLARVFLVGCHLLFNRGLSATLDTYTWEGLAAVTTETYFNATEWVDRPTEVAKGSAEIFWQVELAHDIELYGGGVVLFFGSIGNVLSLAVLCRKRLRRATASMYLAALAFADLAVIIFGQAGRHWVRNLSGRDPASTSYWYCKVWYFIINVAGSESIHLLAGVSAERCIAILAPIKSRSIISKRSAIGFIIGSLLFNCVYASHNFWSFKQIYQFNQPSCVADLSIYFVRAVRPWSDMALVTVGGSVVIVISNIIIIAALLKAKLKREAILTETSKVTENQTKSIVIMLIMVSVAFLALSTPIRVAYIIDLTFPGVEPTGREAAQKRLMWAVNVFLLYCNHSINFYLYVLSGGEFRKELYDMVAELCYRRAIGRTPASGSLELSGIHGRDGCRKTTLTQREEFVENTQISTVENV